MKETKKTKKICLKFVGIWIISAAIVLFSGSRVFASSINLQKPSESVQSDLVLSDYKTVISEGARGYNVGGHDYVYNWQTPVTSYLLSNNDGSFTRLEAIDNTLLLESYSSSFYFHSSKSIQLELPIFGGFYSGLKYNFIVCGQKNDEESDTAEVVRVIKYDKQWNRIDSKSFYGINTYIPFDAGTVSITEDDTILYIHTAHEMYKTSDGLHHQSNMTFYVDKETMKETYSRYDISYVDTGYVSHSFNQVIRTDEDAIYTVDHGDAYPRSIILSKTTKSSYYREFCTVLSIEGNIGNNQTKATLGGMELSKDSIIVTGASVEQDSDYANRTQKNIFLALVSKNKFSSSEISFLWVTDYHEGDKITVGNPYLLKVNENSFIIMWEEIDENKNKTLKCATMNGSGNFTSDIVSLEMKFGFEGLSDCQPIIFQDNIIWYTAGNNGNITFYDGGMSWYGEKYQKTVPAFYKLSADLKLIKNTFVGDINDDGLINGKDSTRLMQYLAGWDVEIDQSAADVNGDGNVNGKDATRLMQYLAGWDVTLG